MLKIITIIAVMLCPVSALTDSEPFTILGFEIPSIENENWLLESDRVPAYSFHFTVEMLFFVSDSGTVDSIQFTSEKDSLYLKNIWNSLNNIRFYPARFNDKAIPFIIPAKIRFENRYGRSKMILEFPFQEPDCNVKKMALDNCLRLNGIKLPEISKFSPYFLGLTGFEENLNYPTGIFEIEIDSSGLIEDFKQVNYLGDDYSKTINNAILYSEFSPLSYQGKQYSSKFYLIVRYFQTIDYPTEIWSSETDIVDFSLSNFKLERSLYLDSIINLPLPINTPKGILNSSVVIPYQDSIDIEVTIDIKGKIKQSYLLGRTSPGLMIEYKKLLGKLLFLPARNIKNVSIDYTGKMKLVFSNSDKVEVFFDWLPLKKPIIE